MSTLEIGSPAEEMRWPAPSEFLELQGTRGSLGPCESGGRWWTDGERSEGGRGGGGGGGGGEGAAPAPLHRGGCCTNPGFLSRFLQRLAQKQVVGAGAEGGQRARKFAAISFNVRDWIVGSGLITPSLFRAVWQERVKIQNAALEQAGFNSLAASPPL